ncbi:hypothetical protein KQY30_01825 [Streptomyces sp. GMY02]|uniref:hypothetical protein n=1 Tax=Streptomyces sp. GMY02 TaxID=1333528 RepID=UPI001C2C8148|nr:hypothetical protein [Streptomyces sp. GMY02]QXE33222.1 hypothetical protein KQY30_01825 [Streptomyces sp. GMY02]
MTAGPRQVEPVVDDPRPVWVNGLAAGTGYLLNTGLVLTSAALAGPRGGTVSVRRRADASPERFTTAWTGPGLPSADAPDVALLCAASGHRPASAAAPRPVRWGRLVTRRANVRVHVGALSAQGAEPTWGVLRGTLGTGSAVKSDRLHITLAGPAPGAPDAGARSWTELRGAAVTSQSLLLGVVTETGFEPGLGWLRAVSAERLLRDQGFDELTGAVGPGALEPVELQPVLREAVHPLGKVARAADQAAGRHGTAGPGTDVADAGFGPADPGAEALVAWCARAGSFGVRLLIGADDHADRLARGLVERMRARGWTGGFLASGPTDADLSVLTDVTVPVLLVLDRAQERAHDLRALLYAVARRTSTGPAGTPLRLLLTAPAAGDWWEDARADSVLLRDLPPDTEHVLPV